MSDKVSYEVAKKISSSDNDDDECDNIYSRQKQPKS
jgi:hypothetical protein